MHPGAGDANYWQNLLRFLKSIDADFGYWAINPRKPRGNERESYRLVEDDWVCEAEAEEAEDEEAEEGEATGAENEAI